MKKIVVGFLFAVISLFSQNFTKITDGDVVNDGGYSFGVAWGDLNNDGLIDLYISNGGADGSNEPNFLYLNNGDGTFSKVVTGDIVKSEEKSNGASLADFDNDGDLDVFVANRNGDNNSLFLNNGDDSFTTASGINIVSEGGNTNGSSWVDYNNDGFPDLFAVNFFGESFLYTNNQDGTFTKFNSSHPVTEVNTSISCAWGDFNNDRSPDLFIPNAAGAGKENYLYSNNGDSSFELIQTGNIVTDKRASMGGVWGDYDNDGDLDLFVANQANFENDLYINNNDGTFTPVTDQELVSEKSYSINASFVDVDNDADLDLYITNWQGNQNFLYLNSGYPDYTYTKSTGSVTTDEFESSMASAWGDYDNDGDLDLFVTNRDDRNNSLFRNETQENNWAVFTLEGAASGKSALGSKIHVLTDINGNSIWQMREITAQHGYNSQNDMRAHFGFSDAAVIDSIMVEWSSGETEIFNNIPVNNFYKVIEGEGITGITSVEKQSNLEKDFLLLQNYPNPFNPSTTISFNIPEEGSNHLTKAFLVVYNVLGEKVATLVNESKQPGNHSVSFDASNLTSGIYFYTLIAGSFYQTRKMVLTK